MEETFRSQRKPSRTGRKLSPSPPRRPRPVSRDPPPRHYRRREPSPTRRRSWVILDRFVHRSRRLHGVVDNDATTSATSHDCVGRPVRASLRVAASPAVSRLHLHLPDRDEGIGYLEDMEEPAVVAAHRNSILFEVVVPFKDSYWTDPFLFPIDYFVYSASSSSPPSLTRLRACFEGVAGHPKEDKYFKPYRRQRQRVMLSREVELCILHHAPPPAGVGTATPPPWTVKRLKITPNMRTMGLNLASFRTDVVIPVSGRVLCWVDYYQGMLLVDFQPSEDADHDQQHLLSFIPLPNEALQSQRPYIDAGDPDPFRCACVTNDAGIKFVCIMTERRVRSASHHLAFTISTWTLDIGRGEWQKDVGATMDDGEFFGLYDDDEAGKILPRVLPSFPVVSMADPDVICFLLKEDDDILWMVEVNMLHKKVQSSAVYIKEQEGDEWYLSDEKVCRNFFFDGHYFIPSQFSGYLSKDAITSWELSDMMQKKVKQRMAKRKSGVGAQSEQFAG
ncbi:uncharacterized protein LOC120645290 [Panicum virgatum]|uniref:DUF1618 domain-containing protein n=1 Tax=Panicum virgatum TaxID=38727 RepID=A0A8T0PRB7_PANVG|nr:uncharacterized protein LOC120645290 [Panicum virgatum]KAG2564230.1 hypothetical protein PVAP13_8KG391700 [Panicum virgatum]